MLFEYYCRRGQKGTVQSVYIHLIKYFKSEIYLNKVSIQTMFKNSVPTLQNKHSVSITQTNRLILFRKIIALL
jgi:hypothetical protein